MKKFGNMLWGVVFIVVGIILGGNALGITNINIFFSGWWTLFIIVPSFIGLFNDDDKAGNVIGLLIGIALLLCCQGVLNFSRVWKLIVPAILVAIGISFIFKDTIGGKISKEIKKLNSEKTGDNSYCATFGGQNINYDDQVFEGADLTAVFGGVKCDLRKAVLTKDVVINTSSIFGGIDILVPEDAQVKIKTVPIFGGASDHAPRKTNENSHTIYINAQCVFGGVEIK